MCGLVGVLSRAMNGFSNQEQSVFRELLIADSLRGVDSTGVFQVDKIGNTKIVKIASHPYSLVQKPQFEDWDKALFQRGKIAIGHNRKATRGEINNENAHPFVHDNITLVHNGFCANWAKFNAESKVDSHAIAVALSGKDKNTKDILGELDGAFAIIWYDIEKKTLNLFRNMDRPLYAASDPVSGTIYLASEATMLAWVLHRNDVKYDKITSIPEMTWLAYDLTGDKPKIHTTEIKKKYSNNQGKYAGGPSWVGESDWDDRFGNGVEPPPLPVKPAIALPFRPVPGVTRTEMANAMKAAETKAEEAALERPIVPSFPGYKGFPFPNLGGTKVTVGDLICATVGMESGSDTGYKEIEVLPGAQDKRQRYAIWGKATHSDGTFLGEFVGNEKGLERILSHQAIIGEVTEVIKEGKTPHYTLTNIRPTDFVVMADGMNIPSYVWRQICANEKCLSCQKDMKDEVASPDFCYVQKNLLTGDGICADCSTSPEGQSKYGVH